MMGKPPQTPMSHSVPSVLPQRECVCQFVCVRERQGERGSPSLPHSQTAGAAARRSTPRYPASSASPFGRI